MNAAQLQSSGRCPTSTRCLAAPSWLPKRPWQQSVLTKAARQLELNRSAARGHLLSPCAFQIDRRHHMELQWQRHQEQEQLLAAVPASLAGGGIIEVSSLAHLEALLGAAGGQLVVLTAYTRSCGICKHVLRELEVVLCEARQQRARIVFMRHDLQDAWDFPTDVARWYKLKTAPRFLFFVDGALLRTASIADSRTSAGSRSQVTAMLHHEHRKLRDTLRELLALHTPSARR